MEKELKEVESIKDTFREMLTKLCEVNDISVLMTGSFEGVLEGAMGQVERATIKRKEEEFRREIAEKYVMKIPF